MNQFYYFKYKNVWKINAKNYFVSERKKVGELFKEWVPVR